MSKIVIVEDELISAEYLKRMLIKQGFDIIGVIPSGKKAIDDIPKLQPDLVIMDIMLNDSITGSEVAVSLQHSCPEIGIIFLTAYSDKEMLEYAVNSNCYGYLLKPYNEQEIINTLTVISARIAKKSMQGELDSNILRLQDNIVFDKKINRLLKDNLEIHLGTKALALLALLSKHPNTPISNEQIILELWGEMKKPVTLRTQIHRIKEQTGVSIIHNVNGSGYMLKTL